MNSPKKAKILVIDDNEAIHKDFRKALAKEAPGETLDLLEDMEASLFETEKKARQKSPTSYLIDTATQGQEGLDKVLKAIEQGDPYTVAFIDVRMPPGWDGIETTKRIWEVQPDLQVVICSAYSDYTWEDIFEALETSDRMLILKKPFQRIEVLQMAQTLAKKWEMTRELAKRMESLEAQVAERTANLESANQRLQNEIQEREAMKEQLLQAKKMEAIGQLTAGIAHEINTPIQFIGDNIKFVKESFENLNPLVQDYQRILMGRQNGETLEKLFLNTSMPNHDQEFASDLEDVPEAINESLEGLRSVSKIIEAMKVFSIVDQENKHAVDLKQSIESTVLITRNEWCKVATCEMEFEENLPMLHCSPSEINQAILGLIVNAAQAIEEQKRSEPECAGIIGIRVIATEDNIEIRISDTGCGISSADKEHIFEPFFSKRETGQGSGQGLAMAYASVVNNHGGSIFFEPNDPQGTVFVIRLPLQVSHADSKGLN